MAAVAVLPTPPARAYTTWGGDFGGAYFYADNNAHDYQNQSLIPQHEIAMDYAMLTRLQATDMTVTKVVSSDTHTDVLARDEDYGAGNADWDGRYTCTRVDALDPERCDQAIIQINQHVSFPGDDGVRSSKVTAHEAGHSVGLLHYTLTDTCMYIYPESATTSDYNAHEKGHINARY